MKCPIMSTVIMEPDARGKLFPVPHWEDCNQECMLYKKGSCGLSRGKNEKPDAIKPK